MITTILILKDIRDNLPFYIPDRPTPEDDPEGYEAYDEKTLL